MLETINFNGSVWGPTTKGTVLVEILRDGNRIEGRFVVTEPGLGQLNAILIGEWSDENRLTATLSQFTGTYSVPVTLPQNGRMDGAFDPTEGVINGMWSTDAQTEGKFLLVKVESAQQIAAATPQVQTGAVIPPLITKTVVLGSYRMDEQSVRRLVDLMKRGTNVAMPAINATHKGSEHIHIGVDNLLADPSVPAIIYNVIVAVSEPNLNVGTNTVVLNLKKGDDNTLFASGYDRIWVEGKTAEVKEFLEEHQSKAAHILRKYGQNLNSLIFLAMLALLPSISSLGERLVVVAFVFVLLLSLMYSWRLAANTKVFLRGAKLAWYEKNAGWLLVLLEVGLTAWVAYLIQRFIAAR